MSTGNFDLYSRYYDLLYRDKDYNAETEYIHRLLQQFSPRSKDILELGSGTGRHARLLAAKGYTVHGVERSSGMVEIANKDLVAGLSYQVGSMESFTASANFDAALSLFHVVSYITDNGSLTAAFRNVHAHLKESGIFIFDVWYSPAVYFQKPEVRVKRLGNEEINITRIAEPEMHFDKNVVDVNYDILIQNLKDNTFSGVQEKHPMRHFSTPEVDLLSACCGFRMLHAEEFLTGAKLGVNTWGACYVLQKI